MFKCVVDTLTIQTLYKRVLKRPLHPYCEAYFYSHSNCSDQCELKKPDTLFLSKNLKECISIIDTFHTLCHANNFVIYSDTAFAFSRLSVF